MYIECLTKKETARFNSAVQEEMTAGWLTTLSDANTVCTLGNRHDQRFHSVWYRLHPNGVIANFKAMKHWEDQRQYESRMKSFVKKLPGLDMLAWYCGNGITLLLGPAQESNYLPDMDLTIEEQQSASGLAYPGGKYAGEYTKSLRVFSHAQYAAAVDTVSEYPYFKISDDETLKVTAQDTGGHGDGMSLARKSVLEKMGKPAGMNRANPNMEAMQGVWIAADYAWKGEMLFCEDDEFPGPKDVDIIIDSKSFFERLFSTEKTLWKLNEYNADDHTMVAEDPLQQTQTTEGFILSEDLLADQERLIKNLSEEKFGLAKERHDEIVRRELPELETLMDELLDELLPDREAQSKDRWTNRAKYNPHWHRAVSTSFSDPMTRAHLRAGMMNPWTSPLTMRVLAGQAHAMVSSKVPTRANPMTGYYVSGRRMLSTHQFYTRTPEPPEGYVDIIWGETHPDRAVAMNMNDADRARFADNLEHPDNDGDTFTGMFMRDQETDEDKILVKRTPQTVDAGLELKLQDDDAEKLRSLGFTFNPRRTDAGHRWPRLHQTHPDGTPVYADRIFAKPVEDKVRWTNDPKKAIPTMVKMVGTQWVIGAVANMLALLDYSGLWGPWLKMNLSRQVIDNIQKVIDDPTQVFLIMQKVTYALMCGWDQTRIVEEIVGDPATMSQEQITDVQGRKPVWTYENVRNAPPMDQFLWVRVDKHMARMFDEAPNPREADPGAAPKPAWENFVRLKPHTLHAQRQEAMRQLQRSEDKRLRRRQLACNGPLEWLLEEPDPEVTIAAIEAFKERNAVWEDRQAADEEAIDMAEQGEINDTLKKNLMALNLTNARKRIRQAVRSAYDRASSKEGYRPGSFVAAWWHIATARKAGKGSRFDASPLTPISIYDLSGLPEEEHDAWANRSIGKPVVIARTAHHEPQAVNGGRYMVRQMGRSYWLTNPETDEKVVAMRSDARNYLNVMVEPCGYLPQVDPAGLITAGENLLAMKIIPKEERE